jgi:hypothetical protein
VGPLGLEGDVPEPVDVAERPGVPRRCTLGSRRLSAFSFAGSYAVAECAPLTSSKETVSPGSTYRPTGSKYSSVYIPTV